MQSVGAAAFIMFLFSFIQVFPLVCHPSGIFMALSVLALRLLRTPAKFDRNEAGKCLVSDWMGQKLLHSKTAIREANENVRFQLRQLNPCD